MSTKVKSKIGEVKVDFSITFGKHNAQKVIDALADSGIVEYSISSYNVSTDLKLRTTATPTQIYNFGQSNH